MIAIFKLDLFPFNKIVCIGPYTKICNQNIKILVWISIQNIFLFSKYFWLPFSWLSWHHVTSFAKRTCLATRKNTLLLLTVWLIKTLLPKLSNCMRDLKKIMENMSFQARLPNTMMNLNNWSTQLLSFKISICKIIRHTIHGFSGNPSTMVPLIRPFHGTEVQTKRVLWLFSGIGSVQSEANKKPAHFTQTIQTLI